MTTPHAHGLRRGATSLATLLGCLSALHAQGGRPNIIFILADDLGYGDLGCYGQQLIATPHIDSLSRAGMRMTDFYAGCSVSAPSRASLLTGLHTGHTHVRGNKEIMPEGQAPMIETGTLAEVLRARGYRTGIFGKWGLGYPGSGAEPEDRGFDTFFGYNCQRQSHSHYPEHLYRGRGRVELPGNATELHTYAPEAIHRAGLEFVRQSAGSGEPFLAMLTYTLPHAELRVPRDSLYLDYAERLTPKAWQAYAGSSYASVDNAHATFASMVSRLDSYVGEVVALVSELGIEGETLIIFTSDNGAHTEGGADPAYFRSSGPLRGTKRALYEGGIRVPMIASWPGHIPQGGEDATPTAFWDILPTLSDLTGETRGRDGVSLLPILLGQGAPRGLQERTLYWEFHEEGGRMALRQGRYKLIVQGVDSGAPTYELYDLSTDLGEKHDLSGQLPALRGQLIEALWRMRTPSELFPFAFERPPR